ncbi:vitelline membrane outer layer protein 1 [Ictalurus punctatus]|uniref:Vitelline membrane outer layer protein 1 n=1 Tax=Ictalurus punctatus TaxID=7998 RepID=A0A2D0SYA7_ICTPU|nr:vitelline membrane outer layer protein 1 [Ictalurus punctatus]
MYFVLTVVLPVLMLSFGECASVNDTQSKIASPYPSTISVLNGQVWGTWGTAVKCPSGTYATGFSLKVLTNQGFWDDTALNGIALQCSKPIGLTGYVEDYTTIRTDEGSWGTWTENIWCPSGVLKSFQLRVESYQGVFRDDTAANNIRFTCTGGNVLEGSGMTWGSWGTWSSDCDGTGICGIQTKVDPPQGIWDDTSLNDVRFYCCS